MSRLTLVATQGYMDNVQSNQQSGNTADHWNYYRVMTLFDIIFDGQQSDAQQRWDTVKANMAAIADLANNQPDVYVICDDTQFWTVSPSNGQPTVFNAPDGTSHQFPSAVTCADTVNGLSQIAYRHHIGGVEYIALCTKQYSYPMDLSSITYQEGSNIMDTQTWSTTFFHEIMHVLPLNQVGDQSGGTAQGGERYGWQGIQDCRSTYSPLNPDSNKLFAMALSMEEWLWNTGTAVSFNAEYLRLGNHPTDNTIANLNLPAPNPGPWV